MKTFTITRNGVDIEVSYVDVRLGVGDSNSASVKFTFQDKFGKTSKLRMHKAFTGAAADALRATVEQAIEAAAIELYGDQA